MFDGHFDVTVKTLNQIDLNGLSKLTATMEQIIELI